MCVPRVCARSLLPQAERAFRASPGSSPAALIALKEESSALRGSLMAREMSLVEQAEVSQ